MDQALPAAVAGFGTTLSLIVAIGAQNTFVLQQGLRRHAVPQIVAICALSDVVLIAIGVSGAGAVVTLWPSAIKVMGCVGGAFLLTYAALAAKRAFRPASINLAENPAGTSRKSVWTCLALTWLNPHVYLDILLLGSLAASHGSQRWTFGLGSAAASLLWFCALGFGARLLTGFFARPASWRALDSVIAATMVVLGVSLLTQAV
jgi:L-lysine exporter family protein LysE/ArgO